MCPYFNRDPTPWQATKSLLHPFLGRRHRTLSHHLSVAIGHIIVARLVSQIHADRKRFLPRFAPCLPPCLLPLRTLWTSCILLHGRFSFCTLSASIPWELTASRWGPAFSFHLGYTLERFHIYVAHPLKTCRGRYTQAVAYNRSYCPFTRYAARRRSIATS